MSGLPPAAQAARAAAAASQSRRNLGGAALIAAFVGGVFTYCINAVGEQQDAITDRELEQFRAQRERQRSQEKKK